VKVLNAPFVVSTSPFPVGGGLGQRYALVKGQRQFGYRGFITNNEPGIFYNRLTVYIRAWADGGYQCGFSYYLKKDASFQKFTKCDRVL
jgi:hypothetical protein